MYRITQPAYKASIFSKILNRDLYFRLEEDEIYPELSVKENHVESDVIDEIKKHYENLGE